MPKPVQHTLQEFCIEMLVQAYLNKDTMESDRDDDRVLKGVSPELIERIEGAVMKKRVELFVRSLQEEAVRTREHRDRVVPDREYEVRTTGFGFFFSNC